MVKISLTNLVFDGEGPGLVTEGDSSNQQQPVSDDRLVFNSKRSLIPEPLSLIQTYIKVLISSTVPAQVQLAFETIIEIITGNNRSMDGYLQMTGLMQTVFLIEHNKAGRVVGPKGANIQQLKLQSGSSNLRVEKESKPIGGVQLRRLIVEGSAHSIKSAHALIMDALQSSHAMAPLAAGPQPSSPYASASNPSRMGYDEGYYNSEQLSFEVMERMGVDRETLQRLDAIRAYLYKEFGLKVAVSRADSNGPPRSHGVKRLREDEK